MLHLNFLSNNIWLYFACWEIIPQPSKCKIHKYYDFISSLGIYLFRNNYTNLSRFYLFPFLRNPKIKINAKPEFNFHIKVRIYQKVFIFFKINLK